MLDKTNTEAQKKIIDLADINAQSSLNWVSDQNEKIAATFSHSPEFTNIKKIALEEYERRDKIPYGIIRNGFLYNTLRDKEHKQGLWRRTTLEEYRKEEPIWEPLLNIDRLPEQEIWRTLTDPKNPKILTESWVLKGVHVCNPACQRALIELSLGGGDRTVYREFDIERKEFVKDGFQIKEGKSTVSWFSEDALWISTDFGEGSLTKSGYPRIVKYWQRGEPLEKARTVFTANVEDTSAVAWTSHYPEAEYHTCRRNINFYEHEYYFINPSDFSLKQIPIPRDATLSSYFKKQVIIKLKSNWEVPNGPTYELGSVVAIDLASITDPEHLQTSLVFSPTPTCVIQNITASKSYLWLSLLNNVCPELYQFQSGSEGWVSTRVPLPELGNAGLFSIEAKTDNCFMTYSNFLIPTRLYYYDGVKKSIELIKTQPTTFQSEQMIAKQHWAVSKDGTKIPYFIVHLKTLKYDGSNATLLNGYGGFEISQLPGYIGATTARCWLEKGGVFVIANIRGGGEFGPAWHQAALKEKRHKSFEDFIAVAEDLIQRKITSPKQLGIKGGSNGGLLVAVAAMQRPELFNAVICDCPLLDMLQYHTMLAGHSWMAEYGNPDDPSMRKILESYSPFHNVSKDNSYPPILFTSSTKDDRVHPAHARKMVDKMQSQGHEVYYYENTEGGHSGAATLEQSAFKCALNYSYLLSQLKPTLKPREELNLAPTFFAPSVELPRTQTIDIPELKK